MLQCSVSLLVSKEDEETFGMVGESVQSHGCNKPCYEQQWTIAALCTGNSLAANKSDLHTEDDGILDTSTDVSLTVNTVCLRMSLILMLFMYGIC